MHLPQSSPLLDLVSIFLTQRHIPVSYTHLDVYKRQIEGSMRESLQDVVRACKTVLEQTPPELASDIVTRGIVLTGGGALLHGIDELLRNELHIPVYVAENALRCVAEGTGILLENLHMVR